MKVYFTEEKELIMEPSLKWAWNPNVAVVFRAYGMKATVQVFAQPRITLKPLLVFPRSLSLMEKPHIDIGLRLAKADLMSIPGLYRRKMRDLESQRPIGVRDEGPKYKFFQVLGEDKGGRVRM
ncbi:Arf guanine nucleotide exchange factor syt1 [Orobanche minor]